MAQGGLDMLDNESVDAVALENALAEHQLLLAARNEAQEGAPTDTTRSWSPRAWQGQLSGAVALATEGRHQRDSAHEISPIRSPPTLKGTFSSDPSRSHRFVFVDQTAEDIDPPNSWRVG